MADTVVTKNATKAAEHAAKAAEASVEPIKEVLVEVGKAKWITPRNLTIAGVTVLVAGTAVVAYKKVRALKAAAGAETTTED
jgi:hypothetical protein